MKGSNLDFLLSRDEVELHFGVPKRFLEISATRGDGPKLVRIGRLVRYRKKDILDWIESNTFGGNAEQALRQ